MARDFAGKAIGVWLPDAAFVSMVRAEAALHAARVPPLQWHCM